MKPLQDLKAQLDLQFSEGGAAQTQLSFERSRGWCFGSDGSSPGLWRRSLGCPCEGNKLPLLSVFSVHVVVIVHVLQGRTVLVQSSGPTKDGGLGVNRKRKGEGTEFSPASRLRLDPRHGFLRLLGQETFSSGMLELSSAWFHCAGKNWLKAAG